MANLRRPVQGEKNGAGPGGVHLFDFNETLSARRLLDDKRIAIDMQMERFYRGKGDLAPPRHSGAKREDAEMIRTVLRSDRRQQIREPTIKELDKQQRAPNVVARLMGLDTLPTAPVVAPQMQTKLQTQQQQLRKKVEVHEKSRPPSRKQQQQIVDRPQEKAAVFSHSRHPNTAREQLELEEMKRQLALKQMLVREKLSEAKRLLSHDKLSGKRWQSANEKLNQSKQFLDAVDFFHTNKEFLGYLDEQESVSHKQLKAHPDSVQRAPRPEGLGNPIVRRVFEERRDEELRQYLSRQSEVKKSNRDRSPAAQVPTRIVVLKPSPNRKGTLSSPRTSTSERLVGSIVSPKKSTDLSHDFVDPKVIDIPKVEAAVSPREIAKAIARQVRENVVRELARNTESTTDKRGTVCSSDNSEEERDDDYGESDDSHGRGRREKDGKLRSRATVDQVEDWSRKPFQSSHRKPLRNARPASGKSPPPTARPVSKGIVVLVPDPSGSSRSRTPEAPFRDRFAGGRQATKKDRRAAARPDDGPRNQTQVEFSEESASGLVGSKSERIVDSLDSDEKVLGYGGSFLLRTTPEEFQLEKDESDIKTVETGYVTDFASSSKSEELAPLSSSECLQFESSSGRTDLDVDSGQALSSASGQVSSGSCEAEIRPEPEPEPELGPEEEDIKECPISTDLEETSLTSENSGQPSPVSVLESSFEDSPSFETISSELEELRRHLRLLKCDGQNDQELPDPNDESQETDTVAIVDKVVVEDHSKRLQQQQQRQQELDKHGQKHESLDTVEADMFEWLEWESFQVGVLQCPEGRKEDQFYVKNILLAAGLIGKSQQKQQVSWSLDPLLFDKLEEYYSRNSKPTEAIRLRRRLLFKLVAEVLETRYNSRTWWQQKYKVPHIITKMPAHISVLYPRKAKFDMDYYLATHMPLVKKHWTQYGLTKYTVTQYDDPESPYSVGCVLEFESMDSFKKVSAGPEVSEVFGDIPNFSNEKPTIIAGDVKGVDTA